MDFGAATLATDPSSCFANPLFRGADPWVTRRDGWYYFCHAGPGGRLEVWKSDSPIARGHCAVVWTPPARGWNRAQVWAPELHFVAGRWHLYYAACDGRNSTHRMGVLRALTEDPQGPYEDMGQLYTGDDYASPRQSTNRWAIDGTILELRGRLYFIWSGWEDHRDLQHLYIAAMSDPCTVAGQRVRICPNDCHPWERVGEQLWERGLHEGPQVLVRNGRVFLVYSCSGSWQPTYKLGMLFMDVGDDPLARGSWTKYPRPVFESTPDVFGVGHCCFTTSPDGREDWFLYHSKRNRWDCWSREVRAQRFTWRDDGSPNFGRPVPTEQAVALPSGCTPGALPEAA